MNAGPCGVVLLASARPGSITSYTCNMIEMSVSSRRERTAAGTPARLLNQRTSEVRHALHAETDPVPSVDAEWALAETDREPLREQLRRGAAAPEHHHRAARGTRLRGY